MAKKFAASLSDAQYRLARAFAEARLTTLSQAVKAFERHDDEQIAAWRAQMAAKKQAAQ